MILSETEAAPETEEPETEAPKTEEPETEEPETEEPFFFFFLAKRKGRRVLRE